MWDDFVAWFQSSAGQRVIDSAVIPALAILVAGVLAALIARAAVRGLLDRADREAVASVVAALIDVARGLDEGDDDPAERHRLARLRVDADVRLRLSGARGAALAADWASLRLEAIEREAAQSDSSTEKDVAELRERLVAWARRPRRAKRLFAADVQRLSAERTARAAAKPTGAAVKPTSATAAPQAEAPAAPNPRPAAAASPEAAPTAGTPQHDDRTPQPVSATARADDAPVVPVSPATTATPAPATAVAAVPQADGEAQPGAAEAGPEETRLSTEPVLVQRTRLDSVPLADPRADHARHARPTDVPVPGTLAAADVAEPPPANAPPAPAVAARQDSPRPAPEPPQPSAVKQAAPAWLDTYDDEAEVTRDIDLSKTPPPMSASAVRDRTQTGDDIVPRH